MGFVDVCQSHRRAHRRKPGACVLGPLDERNRAIEVRLEVAPILRAEPTDAVEVEMSHRDACCVAVPDRERGARNRLLDAKCTARAADEGRLAGAELARNAD